jgi:hypothetical protein
MNHYQYKIGVRMNQMDVEESMGFHKKAEQWDNIGVLAGIVGFSVVLYSYFF